MRGRARDLVGAGVRRDRSLDRDGVDRGFLKSWSLGWNHPCRGDALDVKILGSNTKY